jgi:hypothetical protein
MRESRGASSSRSEAPLSSIGFFWQHALVETCSLPAFRESARRLCTDSDGSFEQFWESFRSRPSFSRHGDETLINDWDLAACSSADEDGTSYLPSIPQQASCCPISRRGYLASSPVRMVPTHASSLRSLRASSIDAGKRDQFFLDLGAEAFRRALEKIAIPDIFFALFDATHTQIE